jgi:hypothetical protein
MNKIPIQVTILWKDITDLLNRVNRFKGESYFMTFNIPKGNGAYSMLLRFYATSLDKYETYSIDPEWYICSITGYLIDKLKEECL